MVEFFSNASEACITDEEPKMSMDNRKAHQIPVASGEIHKEDI